MALVVIRSFDLTFLAFFYFNAKMSSGMEANWNASSFLYTNKHYVLVVNEPSSLFHELMQVHTAWIHCLSSFTLLH